jgi:hypothetical protein
VAAAVEADSSAVALAEADVLTGNLIAEDD